MTTPLSFMLNVDIYNRGSAHLVGRYTLKPFAFIPMLIPFTCQFIPTYSIYRCISCHGCLVTVKHYVYRLLVTMVCVTLCSVVRLFQYQPQWVQNTKHNCHALPIVSVTSFKQLNLSWPGGVVLLLCNTTPPECFSSHELWLRASHYFISHARKS